MVTLRHRHSRSLRVDVDSLSTALSILPFSFVFGSVRVLHGSSSVLLRVLPLPLVHIAVAVSLGSISVDQILVEIAYVEGSVLEKERPLALEGALVEGPLVPLAVLVREDSGTMRLSVLEVSGVSLSAGIEGGALAVRHALRDVPRELGAVGLLDSNDIAEGESFSWLFFFAFHRDLVFLWTDR